MGRTHRVLAAHACIAIAFATGASAPVFAAYSYTTFAVQGQPLDVGPDRILYVQQNATTFGLNVRTISTGQDVNLFTQFGYSISSGFLTPTGAIVTTAGIFPYHTSTPNTLYESRNGVVTRLSPTTPSDPDTLSLAVSGNYAAWSETYTTITQNGSNTTITSTSPFVLRDLVAGTNTVVVPDAQNAFNTVASNGDALFWGTNGGTDTNVWRYRNGTLTKISAAAPYANNGRPSTDGSNVVYYSQSGSGPTDASALMLVTPDGTTSTLTTYSTQGAANFGFADDRSYDTNDGWVVFEKPGTLRDHFDLWTRSPGGVFAYVATRSNGTALLHVGADGSVAYADAGKYYLAAAGDTPLLLGTGGTVGWVDNQWYYVSVIAPEPSLVLPLLAGIATFEICRRGRRRCENA